MCRAIDFNSNARRRAVEIQNIWADRVLPSESQILKAAATHCLPQQNFRERHLAA
jgi:hypothetical protein